MNENKITSVNVTGDLMNCYRCPQTGSSSGARSVVAEEAAGADPRGRKPSCTRHLAGHRRSSKSGGQRQLNVAKTQVGSWTTELGGGYLPRCFRRSHASH